MIKQRIVSRWNSNTVLFECYVPDDIESGLAMRHALEKAVLRGANLSGAVLRDADLSGAVLSDAVLRDADLSGAVLSDADLRDADLSGANLSGAVLRDADLSGANLSGAVLSGAVLSDADLSGAVLRGANLSGADLRGANLSGAVLRGANLSGAVLSDAVLSGADLSDATPEQSIENLDKVRAIVLDNRTRLDMGHWHIDEGWRDRTCAEETLCETTHCLAGWLQVCSSDAEIRGLRDPQLAGIKAAPIASKMFFRQPDEVFSWLEDRKYVGEIAEREERAAKRAAAKEGGAA